MFLGSNSEFVVEGVVPDLQESHSSVLGRESHGTSHQKPVRCNIPTFSISSQFVTIPCSMGYFSVKIPRLL